MECSTCQLYKYLHPGLDFQGGPPQTFGTLISANLSNVRSDFGDHTKSLPLMNLQRRWVAAYVFIDWKIGLLEILIVSLNLKKALRLAWCYPRWPRGKWFKWTLSGFHFRWINNIYRLQSSMDSMSLIIKLPQRQLSHVQWECNN